jgi:nucleotide-binding universal stress UspA family protein
MKTLLIPTDFSANATHAAEYGYSLAKQLKASIILCNSVIVPAEIPQAGLVVWPMEEYDTLIESSAEELKKLKSRLTKDTEGFKPSVSCFNDAGVLTDVVGDLCATKSVDLIVMGTHGSTGLPSFFLGNHSRSMIESATRALLLVPPCASIKPVKKIAFATDFNQPEDDLRTIYALIPMAKLLNAEILLTHIYDEKQQSPDFEKWMNAFLTDLSNKANYPNLYYRLVKNSRAEAGLDWLCANGQVDILAMVHRPHNFLYNLLKGSHTQKVASHISIPLLVMRPKYRPEIYN